MLAGLSIFVTFAAVRAISESWINEDFPEALAVKLELLPLIFPVHMIAGGLALLLVPLAMALRGTRWHKFLGRIAAVDVVLAGLTAIPVALEQPVTRISAAGFTAQALTWMTLLGFGIWHILNGRVAQHRAAMLMMAAVTSGALFFRIYLALWNVVGEGRHFKTFYACDAWVAWMVPLVVTAVLIKSGWLKNQWPKHQASTNPA
jgi:uncharacterized membrane protein YozB (DUF420 family)